MFNTYIYIIKKPFLQQFFVIIINALSLTCEAINRTASEQSTVTSGYVERKNVRCRYSSYLVMPINF